MAGRSIKKILFFNPPGPLYQRGEDRCQANIEESSAVSLRAPNDLAYMAAMVRRLQIEAVIRDYPAERLNWMAFHRDLSIHNPDMLVMSTTTATVLDDLNGLSGIREILPDAIVVAKGALFFSCNLEQLNTREFHHLDYGLAGESETLIVALVEGLQKGLPSNLIDGIVYRENDKWRRNPQSTFDTNLDAMPFPARDLLRNELYVRPDTGEPQATIQTARGCPSNCVFCLTPVISGNNVRSRSVRNIVDEIQECVERYHIRNFFFKADTFTINKRFVIDLCREIIDRKLEIQWVANSRVDTVCDERLEWMRRAGCWLVAFGFESGNDGVLREMKKDATVADAKHAVRLVRNHGLRIYGFFMVGLPWDNRDTMDQTLKLAEDLDCDFYEFHMATPFEGTALHSIMDGMGLLPAQSFGLDYFADAGVKTLHLSKDEVRLFRLKALRRMYLRPSYVLRTVARIRSSGELRNFAAYGWRFLRRTFFVRS